MMCARTIIAFCMLLATSSTTSSSSTPASATISNPTTTTRALSSIMVDAAPIEHYVCNESEDKLITDIWSLNNILYINMLYYKDDSTNTVDSRIFEYDYNHQRFTNVFHFPTMAPLYTEHFLSSTFGNNFLKDVIGRSLSKLHSVNATQTPSILYFGTRNQLRINCQQKWLYTPPSSSFCRFHSIINYLFRVIAIIDPTTTPTTALNQNQHIHIDLYRLVNIKPENFSLSIVRSIFSSVREDHKRNFIEQYIQNSLLALQLQNQLHLPPTTLNANIRFYFSNTLGLFIAWYPSTFSQFDNEASTNCAVMLPIKNSKEFLQLCTQRYNIQSIIELNDTLAIILPDNQLIEIDFYHIQKQYRVFNNYIINIDNFSAKNFFKSFFRCKHSPKSKRLYSKYYNKKQNIRLDNEINENDDDDDNNDINNNNKQKQYEMIENSIEKLHLNINDKNNNHLNAGNDDDDDHNYGEDDDILDYK